MPKNYHKNASTQRALLNSQVPSMVAQLKLKKAAVKESDERIVVMDLAAADGANSLEMYQTLKDECDNITIALQDLPNNNFLAARKFVGEHFTAQFLPTIKSDSSNGDASVLCSNTLDLAEVHDTHSDPTSSSKDAKTKCAVICCAGNFYEQLVEEQNPFDEHNVWVHHEMPFSGKNRVEILIFNFWICVCN